VVPYTGGDAPIDNEQFVDARAEDRWILRELFEQGEIDIDPNDDNLAAKLGSIKCVVIARPRARHAFSQGLALRPSRRAWTRLSRCQS